MPANPSRPSDAELAARLRHIADAVAWCSSDLPAELREIALILDPDEEASRAK